jgi:hypothetical protein
MQYCRRYLVRRLASNTHLSHPYDVRSRAKNGARWRTRERIQMHRCGRRGKKAGGNHDQARIWASKVRVRTQLRTRNAITRVSKSPSRSGRPFLACPLLPPSSTEYAPRNVREKFVHPWTRVARPSQKVGPFRRSLGRA